ncbi:MAG: hypothetical protein ACLR2E_17115 [Lachnospiraceae bacterium]
MEAPLIHEEKIEIHDWRDRCGSDERFSRGEILGPTEKDQRYGSGRKYVIEFRAAAQFAHVSKLFLSEKKDLMQTYAYAEGMAAAIGVDGEKQVIWYSVAFQDSRVQNCWMRSKALLMIS